MILYAPRSSLTTERSLSINTGLLASTVTPGRTAPLWSLTVPVNALCAKHSGVSAFKDIHDAKIAIATEVIVGFLIPLPPKEIRTSGSSVLVCYVVYKEQRRRSINKIADFH